jgi:hypothetical protein
MSSTTLIKQPAPIAGPAVRTSEQQGLVDVFVAAVRAGELAAVEWLLTTETADAVAA